MESQLRTFEQAFIRRKSVDSRMLMQVLQIKRNLVLKNGVVPAQLLRRLQPNQPNLKIVKQCSSLKRSKSLNCDQPNQINKFHSKLQKVNSSGHENFDPNSIIRQNGGGGLKQETHRQNLGQNPGQNLSLNSVQNGQNLVQNGQNSVQNNQNSGYFQENMQKYHIEVTKPRKSTKQPEKSKFREPLAHQAPGIQKQTKSSPFKQPSPPNCPKMPKLQTLTPRLPQLLASSNFKPPAPVQSPQPPAPVDFNTQFYSQYLPPDEIKLEKVEAESIFPVENTQFYDQYRTGYNGTSSLLNFGEKIEINLSENGNLGDNLGENYNSETSENFESSGTLGMDLPFRHSSNDTLTDQSGFPFHCSDDAGDFGTNLDFYSSLNLNNSNEE